MFIYQYPAFSSPMPCPYLADQKMVYEYFFAGELDAEELEWFLSRGWRKFGHYFFRPACPDCRACTPIRVDVQRFRLSRSQKRVLRKCRDVQVEVGPLRYHRQLFNLYRVHSQERFQQKVNFADFVIHFHSPACPGLLARYWLDKSLVAAGYLDQSNTALNSIYFIFDPDLSHLSLGVYGALQEIHHAQSLGLSHYYLGYWTRGCARMAYKAGFRPHELYTWKDQRWQSLAV
jgi:arginine-tRNA-protein transferase